MSPGAGPACPAPTRLCRGGTWNLDVRVSRPSQRHSASHIRQQLRGTLREVALRSCGFSSRAWPVLHGAGSRPCKQRLSYTLLRTASSVLEQQRQAGSRPAVAQPAKPFRKPLPPARWPSQPHAAHHAPHSVRGAPDAGQDPVPLHALLPLLSVPGLSVFLCNLASAPQSLRHSSDDTSEKPSFPPPSPRVSVIAPSPLLSPLFLYSLALS